MTDDMPSGDTPAVSSIPFQQIYPVPHRVTALILI